jgi:hypothetical protein
MTLCSQLQTSVLAWVCVCLASPARAADGTWDYDVKAVEGGEALEVRARFPAGVSAELSVDDGAEPFVRKVRLDADGGSDAVEPAGTSWQVPACATGCVVRYRFDLGQYADQMQDADAAQRAGAALVASPAAWLLRPLGGGNEARLRLHVTVPPGLRFVIGWPRGASPDTWEAHARDISLAPYAGFGSFDVKAVALGAQTLDIAAVPFQRQASPKAVLDWVTACADAVRRYAGQFPIDHTLVLVLPAPGKTVFGRALGAGGATVLLWLGPEAAEAQLPKEWVLVHELTHLMLPSVRRDHHWLEEGLATYVEPLARLRVAQVDAAEVWQQLTWSLPQGLPQAGDEGLDRTPTWGRTYWGGALFWFAADVGIRRRTHNQCSIQDALRGIAAAGGNMGESWPIAQVLGAGDQATGGRELQSLYDDMAVRPGHFDLAGLFRELGVSAKGTGVQVQPNAPLAAIREGITRITPTQCLVPDGGSR